MARVENLSKTLAGAPSFVCLSFRLHTAWVPGRVVTLVLLVSLCIGNYVHGIQHHPMVLANCNLANGSTLHEKDMVVWQF